MNNELHHALIMALAVFFTHDALGTPFSGPFVGSSETDETINGMHEERFADRPTGQVIDSIVIHAMEGFYQGTVSTFKSDPPGSSGGGAHYLISGDKHSASPEDGWVGQMLSEDKTAFHAANSTINNRSIGVELEDGLQMSSDPKWVTREMGLSAVTLTRDIAYRYNIPTDRQHIFGHNEVPDPDNASTCPSLKPPGTAPSGCLYGGNSHHTDPGSYWNWDKFMNSINNPLDLVFAIDTTGSMWDDIDAVASAAQDIVKSIDDSLYDYRIGVVTYKDFPSDPFGDPGDFPFRDDLAFTTNPDEVISALQGIPGSVGGGNDWPESVYSALMHIIDSQSLGAWRGRIDGVDVRKAIILLGDAPGHDPEPFTGYTLTDVVTAAINADPVEIFSIGIGFDPEAISVFDELAKGTGGKFFGAPNAGDVTETLLAALNEVTSPNPNPIPEPSTIFLTIVGFAALKLREKLGSIRVP